MDDEVILALVALFRAAVPETVQVYDGPTPTSDYANQSIIVGVSEGADDATFDVTVDRPLESSVAEFDEETGRITCIAYAMNGDGDLPAARLAGKANRNLCMAAVKADRTLGGLLVSGRAWVEGWSMRQATASGAEVRYAFQVVYTSLVTT